MKNNEYLSEQELNSCSTNVPNYFRDIFPYDEIPKIELSNVNYQINIPDNIWITDTTFRDGQQSMAPFSTKHILKLYDYLHLIDNNSGIIKQTEFFLYGKKDREAMNKCLERGYKFPEVTTWIRANVNDLKLVKETGTKETGILMSCSDFHIYKKLKMDRKKAMDMYLGIIKETLSMGIIPRCHLEDITRADFYGFVLPLVIKIKELTDSFKIRCCDTLGLGLPYNGSILPRSVPSLMSRLITEAGLSSDNLEWHGHNDFYNAVTNSVTAWMYGCASVNTTLFGIGERTGNCPLEAMIIEYGQLKGNIKNVNLPLVTEAAGYFEREIKYNIPPKTPFIGREFNVTRAGIHADGILKDEEIYNIFDTEALLNRPVVVAVNRYSGTAGIAAWINTYFRLKGKIAVDKKDIRIEKIKHMIDAAYEKGRETMITNDELETIVKKYIPEIFKVREIRTKPNLCRVRIHSSKKCYKKDGGINGIYNSRKNY